MTELQRDKDASKELMVLNLHSIYYWGSAYSRHARLLGLPVQKYKY